ncbi:MAG: hypothetical protein ACTSQQ_01870, partial [Candidatus Helarchaeota archaeon]
MLSRRYEYNGRPHRKLNTLQEKTKKIIDFKVNKGIYKFEFVPCCICHNKEFEILSNKERYGLYVSIVICQRCGLIQTNPRMT